MAQEQRLGESDKDYEARKKRVKRTRQGIGANSLAHGGGSSAKVPENSCISNMQTDGTWDGHIAGSGSTIDPAQTASGHIVYEFKWDATDTTGDIEFALGVAGEEKEPNANEIFVIKDGISVILTWDDTAKRYIGSDIEFVTYANILFVVGEVGCFTKSYLPALLIHYDFAELQTGVKV